MSQYKYYIYYLIDPRSGIPFYVGKGTVGNGRIYEHVKEARKKVGIFNPHKDRVIRKILKAGYDDIEYEIVYRTNVEERAFQREIKEITMLREKYGKSKITNITDGGDGFDSEIARRGALKGGAATAQRVKNDPEFAKQYSEQGRRTSRIRAQKCREDPEFAERMRKASRKGGQIHAQRCRNDPVLAEQRKERGRRVGQIHAQRLKDDPEYAKYMREVGRRNGLANKGRKRSFETKHKMSEGQKRRRKREKEIQSA